MRTRPIETFEFDPQLCSPGSIEPIESKSQLFILIELSHLIPTLSYAAYIDVKNTNGYAALKLYVQVALNPSSPIPSYSSS